MLTRPRCCNPNHEWAHGAGWRAGMLSALLATLVALLTVDAPAQSAHPASTAQWRRCEIWARPAEAITDPTLVLPVRVEGTREKPKYLKGEIALEDDSRMLGDFLFDRTIVVALWGKHSDIRLMTVFPGYTLLHR